ncbi:2OG-Fe(II) oxygenase [Catenovulum sediminis]|uniref:2OG-Fe(II) oxygenase n=1 Tax=Catenovulum sediminis TaxID=1740262 RepID=A0ABV1RG51_9ALTE|nr:2OG-Fe(II) oxygenase [Catenovulum sediminis]
MFESALPDSDNLNFLAISQALQNKGFAIIEHAFNHELENQLIAHVLQLEESQLKQAAIGREQDENINHFVRRDKIKWIQHNSAAETAWLNQMDELRLSLNRQLYLGLFSYESHFAQYQPGAFYKTHVDAFKGQANRILSTVYYLNPNWQAEDGGELVIYDPQHPHIELTRVIPSAGTLVIFLSEEFPHEVLPATKSRYSIAGWFRLNASISNHIDPPR